MDYSRPRVRLGASSSSILGASNGSGGGPQMVKTYGRFRQRIAHRDAKVAEDFARVTSVRPILADLLDSSSSDSDFVEKAPHISTPKSRKSSSAASRAVTPAKALLNIAPDFSKPALIATPHEVKSGSREVINSDTSDTENIAPATIPTPKPKSKAKAKVKAKAKAKANETPKTKPKAVSKPITKSKLKPRITPKVNPRKKVEALAGEKAATTGPPDAAESIRAEDITAEELFVADTQSIEQILSTAETAEAPREPSPQYVVVAGKTNAMDVDSEGLVPATPPQVEFSAVDNAELECVTILEQPDVMSTSSISARLAAAPSPIASGRVAKRRVTRPNRPTRPKMQASAQQDPQQDQAINSKLSLDIELEGTIRPTRDISRRVSQIYIGEMPPLMDTDPSLPSALKRKVSDIEMCAPILQQPTPDIDMDAGLVAEPEVSPEAEHVAEDEDMDEKEYQQQKLMGTRALRFKTPSSARVQAFDMDDDDQQPEQPEQTQKVSSRVVADISVEPLLSIAMAESLPQEAQSNHSTASNNDAAMFLLKTPQRKTAARFPDCTTDVPHSPSRMVTPHRVVYSPAPPMTIINPRRTAIFDVPLLPQLDPQTPMPALVLDFTTMPASDPAPMPDAAAEAHKSRLSSDSVSARMSTAGELEPDIEETRVPFLPARRFVQKTHILAACGQIAPIDWAEGGLQACGVLLPEIDPVQHSENQIGQMESESGLCKIGEATYSEVFSAQWRYVPRTRYDRFNSKKGKVRGERLMQVALKIIPFGNANVKSGTGEPQTTLRDLYQEIGATLALSRLSEREREKLQDARLNFKTPLKPKERELGANFVKAFRVCICQGPLPAPLLRAWDRWKAEYPDLCENIRPDYYPPNQLFAVFVLELGGETLENANVSTWKEARSIIRQLALSMALAERHNQFEHRDLHWGNIMITRSNSHQTFLYQLPPVDSRRNSKLMSIPNYKVRCTIIDYTLSRLHIDNDANDATGSKPANYDPANNVFYVALKDESLFRGEGDIQYDVYRKMRDCSKSNWEEFHPHTNVLWLTYVLHKILLTKSSTIRDELMAFAESKLGAAFAAAPVDLKRAASQEVLRRWIAEFEQCETSSQLLKCALLDLYKS